MLEVIRSDAAPAPLGPYSQGIKAGGFVFVAGYLGLNAETGKLAPGGITAETSQVLENVKAVLETAGSSMDRALATFVFMTDLDDFAAMNEVYAQYFPTNPPGRTTVEVKALPGGAHIEITVFALA